MSSNSEIKPLSYTMSLIKGKWKLQILFQLWDKETVRYGELKRALEGITHKMLSSQLKELECDDLVTRTEYPQIPPKVEYGLSARGKNLMPVLNTLCSWGRQHMHDCRCRPNCCCSARSLRQ